MKGVPTIELGKAVIRKVTKAGGVPFWYYNDESIIRQFLLTNTEEQIKGFAKFHLSMMKQTQCYIGIRGSSNPFDLNDIPGAKMKAWNSLYYKPVHLEQRVKTHQMGCAAFPQRRHGATGAATAGSSSRNTTMTFAVSTTPRCPRRWIR